MASTLSQLGINLNLAPVVDINTNPQNPIIAGKKRSFSKDPYTVAELAREFIVAHHREGILCALKHFPGHGSSTEDSHIGVTDITNTWSADELVPFRKLINRGLADIVTTSHVFHARIDGRFPATLSKSAITGILRGQLNFDGVVLTDDMQMGAISKEYGLETAVRKAIEAGVDILLFANMGIYQEDIVPHIIGIIRNDVEQGILSRERIDESYRRIMRLKNRLAPQHTDESAQRQ